MQKFKEGDEVVRTKKCSGGTRENSLGVFNGKAVVGATFTCDHLDGWRLISSQDSPAIENNMVDLTELQKDHLDADSQELVKAGVLNGSLAVLDSTKLNNMLLKLNYKALAKLAKEENDAVVTVK